MDPLNNHRTVMTLTRHHYEAMRRQVAALAPEEACGLVAGSGGRSTEVIPVENILHSPVRYRMEPRAQIDALNRLDEQGWDLLAIYHSHPSGPNYLSETDLAEAYYPESIYLIWFVEGGRWVCKAFQIADHRSKEVGFYLEQ